MCVREGGKGVHRVRRQEERLEGARGRSERSDREQRVRGVGGNSDRGARFGDAEARAMADVKRFY